MMRIRLEIRRHELPAVKILFAVPDAPTTISKLVELVNDLIPLEAEDWGLEDYVVSVGDYECLHYMDAHAILKDGDAVDIRAMQSSDIPARRASSRYQVSSAGAHLIDGIAFGRSYLKRPCRPSVRIPPLKRPRLLFEEPQDEWPDALGDEIRTEYSPKRLRIMSRFEDAGAAEGEEEDANRIEGLEEEESGAHHRPSGSLRSGKRRSSSSVRFAGDEEALPNEESEDDEDDEDFDADPSDISGDESDDNSHGLPSPGQDDDLETMRAANRRSYPTASTSSSSSSSVISSSESSSSSSSSISSDSESSSESEGEEDQEVEEEESSNTLSIQEAERDIPQSKASRPGGGSAATRIRNQRRKDSKKRQREEKMNMDDVDIDSQAMEDTRRDVEDGNAEATKSLERGAEDGTRATKAMIGREAVEGHKSKASRRRERQKRQKEAQLIMDGVLDHAHTRNVEGRHDVRLASTTTGNASESTPMTEARYDELMAELVHSDDGTSTKAQRYQWLKDVINGHEAEARRIRDDPGRESKALKISERQRANHILAKSDNTTDKAVPGKKGRYERRRENQRRLDEAQPEEINMTQGVPTAAGTIAQQEEGSSAQAVPRAQKLLAESPPSGIAASQVDGAAQTSLRSSFASEAFESEAAANQADEPPEEQTSLPQPGPPAQTHQAVFGQPSQIPDSVPAAPVESSPTTGVKRAKLDIASSRRLLFGSLGVRPPKDKADEKRVQEKLSKIGSKASPKQKAAVVVEPPRVFTGDDWKEKIKLSAVECYDEDVTLSTPAFPFVQRWDPQYHKRGKKRKRAVSEYDGQDDIEHVPLNYDDGIVEDYDGADAEGVDEYVDIPDYDTDDFPPLPEDMGTLPKLTKEICRPGQIIAFKQLEVSQATGWQPAMSAYKTATIDVVHESEFLELTLSPRDLPVQDVEYDGRGKRLYSGLEMPQSDDEDDENGGRRVHLEVSFDEMEDPRILVEAPLALDADDDATTHARPGNEIALVPDSITETHVTVAHDGSQNLLSLEQSTTKASKTSSPPGDGSQAISISSVTNGLDQAAQLPASMVSSNSYDAGQNETAERTETSFEPSLMRGTPVEATAG